MDGNLSKVFEILKWDSDFFGFIVAKIIPTRLTADKLKDTLELLKEQKIKLAYWVCGPLDKELEQTVKLFNGFLAARTLTYEINLENINIANSQQVSANIEEYLEAVPDSQLEALALKSGIFSRFMVDPIFSKEQYERLYRRWIRNSLNKSMADIVFVAKNKGNIIGMVTARKKEGYGQIGLISVDESMRNKKLGTSLINQAIEWFILQGCKIAQVVTQANNVAACRLYEKCGYQIKKTEHFYHFWL